MRGRYVQRKDDEALPCRREEDIPMSVPEEPRADDPLAADRTDLLQVLTARFGAVPPAVQEAIVRVTTVERLDTLILAAANAASWREFLGVLETKEAWRLVGPSFEPIQTGRRDDP
jgi:hypothetical protein